MKLSITKRFAVAAALALGALGIASTAQARSDVTWSIGIQVPGVYTQPAPVYMPAPPVYYRPPPVYYQPAPVYVQPAPVYVQPRPVYVQPPAYYYGNDRDWRRIEWERRQWREDRGRDWRERHGRDWR
ncbi:MAG: PXPV repeat protein [Burkholderiaceae bacterium]